MKERDKEDFILILEFLDEPVPRRHWRALDLPEEVLGRLEHLKNVIFCDEEGEEVKPSPIEIKGWEINVAKNRKEERK